METWLRLSLFQKVVVVKWVCKVKPKKKEGCCEQNYSIQQEEVSAQVGRVDIGNGIFPCHTSCWKIYQLNINFELLKGLPKEEDVYGEERGAFVMKGEKSFLGSFTESAGKLFSSTLWTG